MPKIAPNSPLYAQFRQDFPAQAGEGITGDLNYSDTIVPIVDMTGAAGEGQLEQNLQTAWDFSTGANALNNITGASLITNAGFWKVDVTLSCQETTTADNYRIYLSDGLGTKTVWRLITHTVGVGGGNTTTDGEFVVYLRSGDSLLADCASGGRLNVWYRQIATLNGQLVNPQGFSF